MSMKQNDDDLEPKARPSGEVGSEGGAPGDVEIENEPSTLTGSEAGETARPADRKRDTIVRDEAGRGRRSP
jgi:hypothetical protein